MYDHFIFSVNNKRLFEMQRSIFFSNKTMIKDSNNIHVVFVFMYGYKARYAPSTIIEAIIEARGVGGQDFGVPFLFHVDAHIKHHAYVTCSGQECI